MLEFYDYHHYFRLSFQLNNFLLGEILIYILHYYGHFNFSYNIQKLI